MAGAILAEGLKSAWSSGGTTGSDKTPSVSPGLDPGKYMFELLFNKKRREEEEKIRREEMAESKRRFDTTTANELMATRAGIDQKNRQLGIAGIDMLAAQREIATKNARSGQFARDLYSLARG